jgi:hypothetical protein
LEKNNTSLESFELESMITAHHIFLYNIYISLVGAHNSSIMGIIAPSNQLLGSPCCDLNVFKTDRRERREEKRLEGRGQGGERKGGGEKPIERI